MANTVKRKIWLGTIFLFALLILTSGSGIYLVVVQRNMSREVLRDNYESLDYCHAMLRVLDSGPALGERQIRAFEDPLSLQEKNITEPGELEVTQQLRGCFTQLVEGDTSRQNISASRAAIQTILGLNMAAISRKNIKSQESTETALSIIISLSVIVFLIGFVFSVNFPAAVATPIQNLANAIKQISNKNYKHRIYIDNKDEFGDLASAFNQMAERLEYFESSSLNKLMFEKSRAEAVINSLKDASIGIDKNNKVLFANHEALQLLGLKPAEIVGKTVQEVSTQNDLFNFLIHNESVTPFKIVMDNRENYFTREVIEVTQGDNESKVIVLKNITSFKELDVAKTNFIATISHELKTPLAASDFSLKLLEDDRIGKLTDEQKELIQSLKQDNQRVLKILSELLNISAVEAGKIELDVQMVNPYLIVDHALETVHAAARDRRITIEKNMENGLPPLSADAEKCTWVLNNFLTNAIKNSPEDSLVKIDVRRTSGRITFSVTDEGPGIAKEYQPRLFERYFKVPGSRARGTGLGLAISKEFIEAQNGKIWVESEVGRGSVFSFSLSFV